MRTAKIAIIGRLSAIRRFYAIRPKAGNAAGTGNGSSDQNRRPPCSGGLDPLVEAITPSTSKARSGSNGESTR